MSEGDTIDDAELVRAVQAGDVRAFEPLVDRHLDHLRGFIALKLPVAHLVNEIAHEAFVFAYRNLARFEPGTAFRAWLRAIATQLIRSELQRYRREQTNRFGYARHRELELELEQPAPHEPAELELLRACWGELPEPMRTLLAFRYREDLPIGEIAARVRRTQTWVWQALFRLRRALKECIEGRMAGAAS